MHSQVPQHTSDGLQVRDIDVEVHAVDRLVLKHNMIGQHVRRGSCYGHRGLRSSTGPRTHRASSSYNQGMSLQARPGSTQINPESPLSSAHAVPIYLVGLRRSLVSLECGHTDLCRLTFALSGAPLVCASVGRYCISVLVGRG